MLDQRHSNTKINVVVVGGGFSGIQAAWDIQKAGRSCIVLEAKSRIGGRSRTHQLKTGPGVVELGATWINRTTQPKVYETVKRLGLTLVEQYTEGDELLQLTDGTVLRVSSGTTAEEMLNDLVERFCGTLDRAIKDLDLRDFDKFTPESDVSVDTWFRDQGLNDESSMGLLINVCTGLVGRNPDEVGIHYFLDYIKSGGGFLNLISEGEFGAQSLKIKEGTTAVATGLAYELEPGSVLLDTPVTDIHQTDQGATVETATGNRFRCQKVIMAIPTNTYKNIRFNPPLPPSKQELLSSTKPGIYAKMVLTYSHSWWKEAGLQGKVTSMTGPICFSWETSDSSKQQYSLALFIAGEIAARWARNDESGRRESVIDHLCQLVGPELTKSARDVLEMNYVEWTTEEYIGGAPTSAMGPGMLSKYGVALREPFENIHFAGGETAYEWKGYLEGALRAGSRAAEEVVALTRPSNVRNN